MKKTIKTVSVKEPRNYWISRRVYSDESGKEFVKINGSLVAINWMLLHGWDVRYVY